MKTVEYRGAVLQVENWVRFITTDENGTMCGFECKPQIDGNEWLAEVAHMALLAKGV